MSLLIHSFDEWCIVAADHGLEIVQADNDSFFALANDPYNSMAGFYSNSRGYLDDNFLSQIRKNTWQIM
jgi:hypothetical protein